MRLLSPKAWISLAVVFGVAVVILANVHLVYVAVHSQPACIGHQKSKSPVPGAYRAAKSSCNP
jgi:hypothetical protein